jgi:thermitase
MEIREQINYSLFDKIADGGPMRRTNRLILFLFLVVFTLPRAGAAADKEPFFMAREMLVKFKKGKEEKGNKEIAKIGAKLKERLSTIDVSRLKLPSNLPVEKAVKQFSKLNIVDYAEPNYIQKAVWSPSDPHYAKQWGLEKIRVTKGWGTHTGRSSTIIAIVDTGVDLDHPDLEKKLVKGYDYVDNDEAPDDVGGHGTHCAGIAAALSNNKRGVAGVCPNCSIMPVRVLGPSGGSSTDVAKGIVFAADHGAKVISLSLGSYYFSSTIQDALEHAANKGVVIVAAAGNDHVTDAHYPAYFDQSIAVGSTDSQDNQSSFSNYGPWVDVAAPGDNIYSTVPGGSYAYKSGTSMATPYVAGLAGLMFSCPGVSASKVKQAILNSAKPVGSWVKTGRIDVPGALATVGCGGSTAPPEKDPPKTDPSKGDKTPKTPPSDPGTSPEKENIQVKVKVAHGNIVSNKNKPLTSSDDNRLVLVSKRSGFSNFLDFSVEAAVEKGKSYAALSLSIEGMTDNTGNFEIHLFDWKAGAYREVSSVRFENSDKVIETTVPDATGYVNDDGRIQIKFFRKEKLWNGFEIGLDHLVVKGTEAASPPPKKGDPADGAEPEKDKGSLSDKAKKTWEKFRKKL